MDSLKIWLLEMFFIKILYASKGYSIPKAFYGNYYKFNVTWMLKVNFAEQFVELRP